MSGNVVRGTGQEVELSSGHCTSTYTVTAVFGRGGIPRFGLWIELTRHLSNGKLLGPPTQLIATVYPSALRAASVSSARCPLPAAGSAPAKGAPPIAMTGTTRAVPMKFG
ncbi:hypothetical protein A5755_28390 [Mycolicibacterium fortuitum]|uniref:Uncharacterized protein n=1 Tax=Mycolicibacterium fortuitum TaxID=1766 RepID=A0ABD6QKQ7_MYCFO|nr:hypothetical protein A5665_20205 [Mycolicibacterium fortuitum]OBB39668.1 hypothetical protein A5763_26175 [Mycolicibacterium fortuitum]OBB57041.1 hypothetical protein A5755_28390 [Mycolicibacterium fortuitum]OBF78863.1 hypothetical protein A5751_20385 [Mycolicibacterium fortuitum]OBG11220.1 hypothetical protein A5768_11820 [Mycolicibacterium fortuitum]